MFSVPPVGGLHISAIHDASLVLGKETRWFGRCFLQIGVLPAVLPSPVGKSAPLSCSARATDGLFRMGRHDERNLKVARQALFAKEWRCAALCDLLSKHVSC